MDQLRIIPDLVAMSPKGYRRNRKGVEESGQKSLGWRTSFMQKGYSVWSSLERRCQMEDIIVMYKIIQGMDEVDRGMFCPSHTTPEPHDID